MRELMNLIENANDFEPSDDFIQALDLYVNSHPQKGSESESMISTVFGLGTPDISESLMVYRGCGAPTERYMDAGMNFKNNTILRNDYYLSTTKDYDVAKKFIEKAYNHCRFMRTEFKYDEDALDAKIILTMFEIKTLAGAKGIIVDDFLDSDWQEREVILNRNSEFKVVKTEKKPYSYADDWKPHDWHPNVPGYEYWHVHLEMMK